MIEIRKRNGQILYTDPKDGLLVTFIENKIRDLQPFAEADLSRSSLPTGDFKYGRFDGADFREAVLVEADFRGAKLDGADFTGAILSGAKFEGASVNGTLGDLPL